MLSKITGAVLLFLTAALPTPAAELPQSGNPVFDRAVRLVVDNFYDRSTLDRFEDAASREIQDSRSPVTAASPAGRIDTAIDTILASLQASHTGRFQPDGIDYFELADDFRYALRSDMRRLF
ncbi:carboxyl-terminal protease, partial [Rhizobiaceae sp. 2RAB30]